MSSSRLCFTSVDGDRPDNLLFMNSDPKSIVSFIETVEKAGQTSCDFRLEKQSKTPLLSIVGSMKFDYLANSSGDISRKICTLLIIILAFLSLDLNVECSC